MFRRSLFRDFALNWDPGAMVIVGPNSQSLTSVLLHKVFDVGRLAVSKNDINGGLGVLSVEDLLRVLYCFAAIHLLLDILRNIGIDLFEVRDGVEDSLVHIEIFVARKAADEINFLGGLFLLGHFLVFFVEILVPLVRNRVVRIATIS